MAAGEKWYWGYMKTLPRLCRGYRGIFLLPLWSWCLCLCRHVFTHLLSMYKMHTSIRWHRRTGQFFLGGWAVFARKICRHRPKKTAMLTCIITLPDSPRPVIISKNPGYRALISLDRMNSVFFRLINTKQDSWAIAKKTARCAQYMGELKSFESPHYAPDYFSRNL